MWESHQDNQAVGTRNLSPIPEFDYYNADDEDDISSSGCSIHDSATARLLAKLSNSDLAFEWSMLCQDCTDCWSQNGKQSLRYSLFFNGIFLMRDFNAHLKVATSVELSTLIFKMST